MHRVRMLLHFNITPYIVFDGDYLPSKSHTEAERRERRAESRKLGLELLNLGKTSQAHLELQKAVDVTPEMARQLIEELKKAGVDYVVAPYEADAQLVYLEKKGLIQGILSEDSDMLVFGAKCLLTKLDQYGECMMVHRRDFTACREVSLVGWTDADFRHMAILSGCDYLPSINNMGLKTAYRLLRKYKNVERLMKQLQWDGKWKIPKDYLENFRKAESTFLYQWVWCPEDKRLANLTKPPDELDLSSMEYIGSLVEPTVAMQVAAGDVHPHTKEVINLDLLLLKNSKWPAANPKVPAPLTPGDDMKKNKAINTFFKPRRTPLAELDPNSFTPSPSQQQLLQQRQPSWPVTPALTHSASRRRDASHASIGLAQLGRTVSAPSPSKRPRLCADDPSPPRKSSVKVEKGASRFFSSPPNIQPSGKASKSRSKSAIEPDFQLWSDDSIGEAMADLTDSVVKKTQTKKKLEVFRDDSGYSSSSLVSMHQETPSVVRASATNTQDTGLEQNSVFKASINAELDELRSKYLYQNAAISGQVGTASLDERKDLPEHVPPLQDSQNDPKAKPAAPVLSDSEISESETGGASPTKSDLDGSTLLDDRAGQTPIKVLAKVQTTHDTDTKAKRLGDLTKSELITVGSEDMLVPDSEAESDMEASSPISSRKLGLDGGLNLGRFVFNG